MSRRFCARRIAPIISTAHRRIIRSRKRAYFELIRQTLEKLAAEGKLRHVNPSVATFSLLGMINWISRWYRRDGRLSPPEITRDMIEIAVNSVLKSGVSRKVLDSGKTLARKKAGR